LLNLILTIAHFAPQWQALLRQILLSMLPILSIFVCGTCTKRRKSTPSHRRKGRDCFLHRAAEIVRRIVYIHPKIKG
jgi:hypothetical protein